MGRKRKKPKAVLIEQDESVTEGSTVWHSGVGAPSQDIGVTGQFYLDSAASCYYLKSEDGWRLCGDGQSGCVRSGDFTEENLNVSPEYVAELRNLMSFSLGIPEVMLSGADTGPSSSAAVRDAQDAMMASCAYMNLTESNSNASLSMEEFTRRYQLNFENNARTEFIGQDSPCMAMLDPIMAAERRMRDLLQRQVVERGMPIDHFASEFAIFRLDMGRRSGHTSLALALLDRVDGHKVAVFPNGLRGEQERYYDEIRRNDCVSGFNYRDFDRMHYSDTSAFRDDPPRMVVVDNYSQVKRFGRPMREQIIAAFTVLCRAEQCPYFVFLG